jgi:hypothetical protein
MLSAGVLFDIVNQRRNINPIIFGSGLLRCCCVGFFAFFKNFLNCIVKANNVAGTNRVCIDPVKAENIITDRYQQYYKQKA